MGAHIDFKGLQDFFSDDDVDWKPIAVSKKTGKALAAAYVSNRAIMDRLDEVCGPENWKNEYQPGPGGGVICGISIRVGDEWVTKWDGSENTDVEAVKGGLSTSMRRAAVQWGIGRYMYRLPNQWVPIDQHGRLSQRPKIPAEFLPSPAGRRPGDQGESRPTLSGTPNGGMRRTHGGTAERNGHGSSARTDADPYRLPG